MSDSIDLLVRGLLDQFSSLRSLEDLITNLTIKQDEVLKTLIQQNDMFSGNTETEISLMMKKMNFYRLKLKKIRSEMLYIHQRVTELKRRALEMQEIKVNEMAEKVKRYDYEASLIAKSKVQPKP